MKSYWYDNVPSPRSVTVKGDQRKDHDSGHPVDPAYLSKLGVLYQHCPTIDAVDEIATERSYKNRDEIIVSPEKMGPVYEDKVKMFFHEHLHEDEEIRYVLDGEGFFDVRGADDEWVRIRLTKEDLIILPAGIYHRFTTDSNNVRHASSSTTLVARLTDREIAYQGHATI
ncbi:MAG: hypothetical protein Q9222_000254 [Ikaeria aurantiellina]